jgi:hypothetical protein
LEPGLEIDRFQKGLHYLASSDGGAGRMEFELVGLDEIKLIVVSKTTTNLESSLGSLQIMWTTVPNPPNFSASSIAA